jgi:L-fucose mutarotase/ribose pyranase (RbsD/FucU family)
LVISDSNFPSHNTREESIKRKNHEVLSCKCGVLGGMSFSFVK